MEILNITDKVFYKYQRYVKGRQDCSKDQCRRLLTRDFILGHDKPKRLEDSVIRRRYGNLNITVDMESFTVTDIFNDSDNNGYQYINQIEKEQLNKTLNIEKNNNKEKIIYINEEGKLKSVSIDFQEEINQRLLLSHFKKAISDHKNIICNNVKCKDCPLNEDECEAVLEMLVYKIV